MSQLQTIPRDSEAVPVEAETLAPCEGRKARLTKDEIRARVRERNRAMFSKPPMDKLCECGEPATLWNSGRDATCRRCDFLYSFAKRMEVQGRILGFSRKGSGAYMPVERVAEPLIDLFLSWVDFRADEMIIVGHGTYHLPILKEAA